MERDEMTNVEPTVILKIPRYFSFFNATERCRSMRGKLMIINKNWEKKEQVYLQK